MSIVLYQPTLPEINHIIEGGKGKYSAFAPLYRDAHTILQRGNLGFAFESWYCLSQADPALAYRIQDGACNCPSYTKAQFVISGRIYCKHLIAYYALLKILSRQFTARWIGCTNNTHAIVRYRQQPNTWLLKHPARPAFHAWNGQCGIFVCHGERVAPSSTDHSHAPANPLQFANFSAWLATAQPVEVKPS